MTAEVKPNRMLVALSRDEARREKPDSEPTANLIGSIVHFVYIAPQLCTPCGDIRQCILVTESDVQPETSIGMCDANPYGNVRSRCLGVDDQTKRYN